MYITGTERTKLDAFYNSTAELAYETTFNVVFLKAKGNHRILVISLE